MKKLSKLVIGLSLFALSTLLVNKVQAQYQLIWAAHNDVQFSSPNATPVWMNNGVFENSNGTAYAVTWDENGGYVYFEVRDYLGQTTGTITCAGAGGTQHHPDIVIGGDNTNTYVAVVYQNTNAGVNNIYMELYTITNIGTNTALGYTTCSPSVIQVTNTGTAYDPHIDLANEIVGTNTYVTADEFAIAWEDDICTMIPAPNTRGARACAGSLIAYATCATGANLTYSTCLNVLNGAQASGGKNVDIALNYQNSQYIAQFVFDDPTLGNLYLGKWDITTATLTKGLSIDNPGAGNIEYPRIDVLDQIVPAGDIDKETVYRYYNGLTWDVMSVNQLYGGPPFDNASAYYNTGTGASNNSKPVVAAGTQDADDQTFSIAYANSGDNNVWLNSVEWNSGLLTEIANPGDKDYYNVNYNTGYAADDPVAISNDYIYATGAIYTDKVFTCWYNTNTSKIDCKATSTFTPGFKPAKAERIKVDDGLSVYPIPTRDKLYVESGSKLAKHYSISDVLGRTLMEGPVNNKTEELNIAKLAKGLYLLNITNADNSISGIKITKE